MSPRRLNEGAILVADSHYAPWRTAFIDFLRALECGKIQTTQLILMGDNCDLLFGPIDATLRLNHDFISLLNTLSRKIEIIYLEGNHDFRLRTLFPNIVVVSRQEQPFLMMFGAQKIALLHGDTMTPFGYEVYTALIRNRFLLFCLNVLNNGFKKFITNNLEKQMKRKHHCQSIDGFETIAHRYKNENWIKECDIVIEGHYHQNKSFDFQEYRYSNLGAFACKERIYRVKSFENQLVLDETIFCTEAQ